MFNGSTDLKRLLFRAWPVRALVGLFFLCRGTLYLFLDRYKSASDFCWIYRVSRIRPLRWIAYRIVLRFISDGVSRQKLVEAFLKSKDRFICEKRYLGSDRKLDSIFRDIIVIKPAHENEKGVLLLKYTAKFDLFVSLFDLDRVMEDYYLVLEPCWAGYCDPSILMFVSTRREVIIQCPERGDFDFIRGLKTNLTPIALGASDWVDADLFSAPEGNKEYDLIMVANWAKHKNHRRLFDALSKVRRKPISLLLIGYDWGGRTDEDILREMKHYNLDHVNVEIKKNLPAHQVAEYLGKAKAFLLLSEKEGSNKAIVEALFSNVPAIVYEGFIGGAKNKINPQTGILSSFNELADKIDYVIENHGRFAPRAWALAQTGSKNATKILNHLLRGIAVSRGESWSIDIVEKVNNPNLAYKVKGSIPPSQHASSIANAYLRKNDLSQ
jgi:glycosyltransferase involved in cell wall biosynthesis